MPHFEFFTEGIAVAWCGSCPCCCGLTNQPSKLQSSKNNTYKMRWVLKVIVFFNVKAVVLKHFVLIPGIKTGCGVVLKPGVFDIYSSCALDTQQNKKGLRIVLKPVVNGIKAVVKGIKTCGF